MTRVAGPLLFAIMLAATPALADHGAPFRIQGMSPLMTALVTGGLAFLVALVVVVIVMVLTRPRADRSRSDSR